MEKTEKVMENHGIFCNLKSTNPGIVLKMTVTLHYTGVAMAASVTVKLRKYTFVLLSLLICGWNNNYL